MNRPDGLAIAELDELETAGAQGVTMRLVSTGPRPVEVADVLTQMGCPAELAADFVGASLHGDRPAVLLGATAAEAARVADALRQTGATVGLEVAPPPPAGHPSPPPGLSPALPEVDVVERYLAAYDAGDEAALVVCLTTTAVLSDASGAVVVRGGAAIGRRMAQIFAYYPDRKVAVLGRLIAGPWVIDRHRTSFGGASEDTVFCFRVEGGLIARLVVLT
jgi:hypothetical protein